MYWRQERINEQDVPESQHTVFIRGLPGSVTTSEIREFFEDEFGSCSFDFIKFSADREKLHIAVRFESKTAAKQCMDKYKEGELFGYQVQLTWFRDIRRFLNHVQKQSVASRSRRRYDDDKRRVYSNRTRKYRSKSKSYSKSRSVSRSSRSASRRFASRSPSNSRHSSVVSNHAFNSLQKTDVKSVSPELKKIVKKNKKDRKKRRRSSSESHSHSPSQSNEHSSNKVHVISSLDSNDMDISNQESNVSKREPESAATILQNSSFTLDLNSNNPIRQNIKKSTFNQENENDKSEMNESDKRKGIFLPISDNVNTVKTEFNKSIKNKQDSFDEILSKREKLSPFIENKKVVKNTKKELSPKIEIPKLSSPVNGKALTNFKTIQKMILQDVRYRPREENDEMKVGNFRLSALSTQKSAEQIREEKLARFSDELLEKVNRKKLQLELSYRHDCETFGLMTRKLIVKDRTLEGRLRLALLEVMKDLETEAMKSLDDYIDQMIFLTV